MRIHWCGIGPGSGPGLRRLSQDGFPVTIWVPAGDGDQARLHDLPGGVRRYVLSELDSVLGRGDIVVSMLRAEDHADLARHCIGRGAHFLWPGHVSPELAGMDDAARRAGSVLMGGIGLDPGLDHLMAQDLVTAYRMSLACRPGNVLSFQSVSGSFPVEPGPFRGKFNHPPTDMLRTLSAPARYRRGFVDLSIAHPWDGLGERLVPLPRPQTFEVHPIRDSQRDWGSSLLDSAWTVREFFHGTLRPLGWAMAWQSVFDQIAAMPRDAQARETALAELSERLAADHPYHGDEPDRVVMEVTLLAEAEGRPVWHQSWVLDAEADTRGSALARLVSVPVALCVLLVMAREIPVGVHPAPHDPRLVRRLLDQCILQAQTCLRINHLR